MRHRSRIAAARRAARSSLIEPVQLLVKCAMEPLAAFRIEDQTRTAATQAERLGLTRDDQAHLDWPKAVVATALGARVVGAFALRAP
jgi:hypothetical protein